MERHRISGWIIVSILAALNVVSFVDRLMLSILIAPIQHDLHLSDTSMGLLFGTSFAVLYSFIGLPLARVADNGNRRILVTAGAIVWSSTTILSAFSNDYWTLLGCRAGVAVGEAVLTPAAVSLISDLFPQSRRALPTAIFIATSSITAIGAFFLGGLIVDLAEVISPMLGSFTVWRLSFALVGIPGIVLALVFLTVVREPERTETSEVPLSVREVASIVTGGRFVYLLFFTACGLMQMVAFALVGWMPTLLIRGYHYTPAGAAYLFGAIGVVSAVIGNFSAPMIAHRLMRAGRSDGIIIVAMGSTVIAVIGLWMGLTSQGLTGLILGLFCALPFMTPALGVLPPLAIAMMAPPRARAQLMAFCIMIFNLLGIGAGPPIASMIAGRFFPGPLGYAPAIALMAALTGPITLLLLCLAWKPFRAQLQLVRQSALAQRV